MIVAHSLPRIVERGVLTTLSLDVRDDAGTAQTFTAGTIAIQDGNDEVLAATAFTTGAPASYSLAAATTSGRGLSERWIETWTGTISGTAYTFVRRGYLVRSAFYPTLTDTDLIARHTELGGAYAVLPSGLTSFAKYRNAAHEAIQRRLIGMGRRPWLIFDTWALYDAHLALTMHMIARDFAQSVNGRWKELEDTYKAEFEAAFGTVNFSYDTSEEGTLTDDTRRSGAAPLLLSAGRVGQRVERRA